MNQFWTVGDIYHKNLHMTVCQNRVVFDTKKLRRKFTTKTFTEMSDVRPVTNFLLKNQNTSKIDQERLKSNAGQFIFAYSNEGNHMKISPFNLRIYNKRRKVLRNIHLSSHIGIFNVNVRDHMNRAKKNEAAI
jgi:hypothetical protein